jgi:hypothetical protein
MDKKPNWCIRPLLSGQLDRSALRKNDPIICHCGQPTCRDADIYHKRTQP